MTDFIFVTGNMGKVEWLEKFLGREVRHHKVDVPELQSPIPEEVLEHKAKAAYKILGEPVLVDDVSLVFKAWGDIPGTFVKFFVEGPGLEKMCRMLDGFEDRAAVMRVSYGLYDGSNFKMVSGETTGEIAQHPGDARMGHGFDPLFIPDGETQTHGEMDEKTYKQNHPRGKAVAKLKALLSEAENNDKA